MRFVSVPLSALQATETTREIVGKIHMRNETGLSGGAPSLLLASL